MELASYVQRMPEATQAQSARHYRMSAITDCREGDKAVCAAPLGRLQGSHLLYMKNLKTGVFACEPAFHR